MAVFDVIMLAILLLCLVIGLYRGFILTLCGLLALIVAIIGARFAADHFAPAVTEAIAPRIETVIAAQLEASVDKTVEEMTKGTGDGATGSFSGVLGFLQRAGLYDGVISDVQKSIQSGVKGATKSAAKTMAEEVSRPIGWGVVYAASFAIVLLLWNLISKLLNLVAKLPGVRTFNRLLGGVCGLAKGLLITGFICFLILFMGLLPSDLMRQSVFLQIFSRVLFISI